MQKSQDTYSFSPLTEQQWELRKMPFSNFASQPFYATSFDIDLTKFQAFRSQNSISKYLGMLYIISRAANQIQQFRYRIRNNQIVCYEKIGAGITILTENKKLKFGRLEPFLKFSEFVKEYQIQKDSKNDEEKTFFGHDIVYNSCLPWFPFNMLTHAVGDPNDCIPRIAWGKVIKQQKKSKVTISVQVNHRTVDGYHLGLFYNQLVTYFDQPEKIIEL